MSSFWTGLFQNELLLCALMGWAIAQILKTLIFLWVHKKLDLERLIGSGGMPSSHSATVCALASSACVRYGAASPAFAIAAVVAIIVMYDARGVRRETGKQAVVINEMIELFEKMNGEAPAEEKLKEFIGHSPLQVLIGGILGVIVGVLGTMYLF